MIYDKKRKEQLELNITEIKHEIKVLNGKLKDHSSHRKDDLSVVFKLTSEEIHFIQKDIENKEKELSTLSKELSHYYLYFKTFFDWNTGNNYYFLEENNLTEEKINYLINALELNYYSISDYSSLQTGIESDTIDSDYTPYDSVYISGYGTTLDEGLLKGKVENLGYDFVII